MAARSSSRKRSTRKAAPRKAATRAADPAPAARSESLGDKARGYYNRAKDEARSVGRAVSDAAGMFNGRAMGEAFRKATSR